MGCSLDDGSCGNEENPPHPVALSSFEMLETEVTEAQYEAATGEDPSCDVGPGGGGGPNSPVECVDWYEAKAFCEAVGGRLCTEGEWEYAARGGTTTKYYCGTSNVCLDDVAWYSSNSEGHKHDVKSGWKSPNNYGLYDLLGNVWEWTADCWHEDYDLDDDGNGDWTVGYPAWTSNCSGSYRVCRGGSFVDVHYYLRVSLRSSDDPSYSDYYLGIRCCRTLEP